MMSFNSTPQNGLPVPSAPTTGNFIGIGTVVLSSASRGSVTLRGNDPFDSPLIDPALMKSKFDKAVMREAVRKAFKFLSAPAWSDYVIGPVGALATAKTDAQLDAYVAANAGTIFHPTGTAIMSAKRASDGVVDPDLRVKKVSGLRVVDASVLVSASVGFMIGCVLTPPWHMQPHVPSGHTQVPVYVFAERASDLIKDSY